MSVFAVAVAAFVATTVVVANFVIDVVSKAIVAVPATAFDVMGRRRGRRRIGTCDSCPH